MLKPLRAAFALLPDFITAAWTAYLLLHPSAMSPGQMMGLFLSLVLFELLAAGACMVSAWGLRDTGVNAHTLVGAGGLAVVYAGLCALAYAITGQWQVLFATLWLLLAKASEAWFAGKTMQERMRELQAAATITMICWFIYVVVLAYGSKHFDYMTTNDRGERVVDFHSTYAALLTAGYFVALGITRLLRREYLRRKQERTLDTRS